MTDQPVRSVLVIGASSGIGLATARGFARRGAQLVLAARSVDALRAASATCLADGAATVVVVPADVGDRAAVDALFERAAAEHGQVDVVVHTATVMAYGSVADLPGETFDAAVHIAVSGTFSVAQAALRQFRAQGYGTLVVVNSLLGSIAAPQMGAYVSAKWGQAGLLRTLHIETRRERRIHVCAVSPGGVNTPIYAQAANVTRRSARPPIPVDQPEKVADAVLRCVERPRPRVSVGLANPLIVFGFRFLPWVYDGLVGPLLQLLSLTRVGSTEPSDGNVFAARGDADAEHGPWHSRWRPRP